jgi:hypothetical protein
MTLITLKLTIEELELLTTLASDQLFRREFIDPRMPGHRANPKEMALAKALVGRMRLMVSEGAPERTTSPKKTAASLKTTE